MTSAGIMSFFGRSKPYDAQIEFIRTDFATASLLDTGFHIDDNDWVIEWDGMWYSNTNWRGPFMAYTDETSQSTRILTYQAINTSLYAGYRRQANSHTRCDLANGNSISQRNRMRLSYMKLEVFRYSTGETQTFSLAAPSGTYQSSQTLKIQMQNGTGAFYGFKIWHSGQLMMDLMPVRIGAEPCFYDTVTKKVMRIVEGQRKYTWCGPDIVPVEYIQSTGTQWIDTNVLLDLNNSDWTISLQVQNATNNRAVIFGNYYSGNATQGINLEFGGTQNSHAGQVRVFTGNGINSRFAEVWLPAQPLSAVYNIQASFNNSTKVITYTNGFTSGTLNAVSPTGNPSTYKMRAFSDYREDKSPISSGGMKMYGIQVEKAGALATDLIPVRVGTQGAMYDKLTRVVYRNSGTGSFTVGKDLTQRPQVRPSEIGGYVQDGLIGMWDAKENNGVGSNSNRTTSWKNLGSLGDTYDFTLDSECYWTPNAMVVYSYTAHATSPMIPRDQIKTMEIVFRPRISYNVTNDTSRIRAFTFGDRFVNGQYNMTRRILAWDVNSGKRGWMFATGNSIPSGQSGTSMPVGQDVKTFSVVYPAANDTVYASGSTPVRVMRDGTQWNVSSWINEGDACQLVQTIGNPRTTAGDVMSTQGIRMEVFCVRLYNRQLTVEEQNANHALDMRRFS